MNTVLLATERDLEQNLLAQALSPRGFELVRSRDGLEALEAARAHPPQVLVANVSMPRMDGFALFRRCKQDDQLRRIPFILYSPRSNDEKSERFALELGATRFVGNALKSDAMLRAIEEVLTEQATQQPASEAVGREAAPAAQVISLEARQLREQSAKLQHELEHSQAQLQTLQQQLQAVQTQAQSMQQQLTEATQVTQFAALFNANPVAMWVVDKVTQGMLAVNDAALRLFGYGQTDFLKLDSATLLRSHSTTAANTTVLSFRHRDGRALSLILNSRDIEFGGTAAELMAAHDVSYRVRGERAIVDELQRVKTLLSAVPLPYWVIDAEGKLLDANELFCSQSGYRREELLGRHLTNFFADVETWRELDEPTSQHTQPVTLKYKNGDTQAMQLIVNAVESQHGPRVALLQPRTVTIDRPAPTNTTHVRLMTVLEMLRYADGADETTLLQYAVAQLAAAFGSPLALFAALDKQKTLQVLALSHAQQKRATDTVTTIAAPAAWREGLMQRRIMIGETENDAVVLEGVSSLNRYIACPVMVDRDHHVLVIANRDSSYSDAEHQEAVDCADILTALLAFKRQQAGTQALYQQSQGSIVALLDLFGRVVDRHDPFAAGSGARIASLAAAIGRELGVSAQRLATLQLAAQLHDIGHLLLPQELLLRPDELSPAEHALLETHPERGAQLLSGLHLATDVAEIIAQHHERCDGSGYPRGVRRDDILLEARIVAVADVVEAMCNARAYRPALGLPAALVEITQNSGRLYDEQVVAACARIFAATHQQWPE